MTTARKGLLSSNSGMIMLRRSTYVTWADNKKPLSLGSHLIQTPDYRLSLFYRKFSFAGSVGGNLVFQISNRANPQGGALAASATGNVRLIEFSADAYQLGELLAYIKMQKSGSVSKLFRNSSQKKTLSVDFTDGNITLTLRQEQPQQQQDSTASTPTITDVTERKLMLFPDDVVIIESMMKLAIPYTLGWDAMLAAPSANAPMSSSSSTSTAASAAQA